MHKTYVGINGGGNAVPCGRPGGIGGAPPPGLVGTAGAGRPVLGGGGGTLEPPEEPKEPIESKVKKLCSTSKTTNKS